MKGKKRLPTQLKIIKGTLQKCRTNFDEPVPADVEIIIPDGMSDLAQKHWGEIFPHLDEAGILTILDVTALRIYCETYAIWIDATDKLQKTGAIVKCPRRGIPMRSPYLIVAERSFEQISKMLTEFGMTPSSRSKVRAIKKHEKVSDPWDTF